MRQQLGKREGIHKLMSGGHIMRENTWFQARLNLIVGVERNPSLPFPCTRRWHISGGCVRSLFACQAFRGRGAEGRG